MFSCSPKGSIQPYYSLFCNTGSPWQIRLSCFKEMHSRNSYYFDYCRIIQRIQSEQNGKHRIRQLQVKTQCSCKGRRRKTSCQNHLQYKYAKVCCEDLFKHVLGTGLNFFFILQIISKLRNLYLWYEKWKHIYINIQS